MTLGLLATLFSEEGCIRKKTVEETGKYMKLYKNNFIRTVRLKFATKSEQIKNTPRLKFIASDRNKKTSMKAAFSIVHS